MESGREAVRRLVSSSLSLAEVGGQNPAGERKAQGGLTLPFCPPGPPMAAQAEGPSPAVYGVGTRHKASFPRPWLRHPWQDWPHR